MGRGLGSTQRKILAALQTPCEECNRVCEKVELPAIAEMVTRCRPCWCINASEVRHETYPSLTRAAYSAVARAVIGLERRGIVTSEQMKNGEMSDEHTGKHGHGVIWKRVRLSVEYLDTSTKRSTLRQADRRK